MNKWKGRRKAAIMLQYSQELLRDSPELDKVIKKDFEREKRKLIARDSIRVLEWRTNQGYNADDFMQNMFSILFTGRCYKIPRIVKKLLLK
jgi:hypothetical protein